MAKKSNCETALEQMTSDRDHWRKLARQYKEQVAESQRQLERQTMIAKAIGSGVLEKVDSSIAQLQVERDDWKREALNHRTVVERYLPNNTLFGDYEPGAVKVGISVFFRYGADAPEWEALTFDKQFHGSLDDAKLAVLPAVAFAAGRVPALSDIPVEGDLPGVSRDQLINILHELTPYYYGMKDQYLKARLVQFDRVADNMLNSGQDWDRNHARTRFNQIVDGAFSNADRRHNVVVGFLAPGT